MFVITIINNWGPTSTLTLDPAPKYITFAMPLRTVVKFFSSHCVSDRRHGYLYKPRCRKHLLQIEDSHTSSAKISRIMQQTNLSFLILFSQIIVTSLTKDILSEWEVSIFIAFLLNILKIILQIFRLGSFNMENFTNWTRRIASEG